MYKIIKGNNVIINQGCHIGNNVILEDDVFIDYNCIIRDNVIIKKGSFIGANTILGEYNASWYNERTAVNAPLEIGERALIRSGSILYAGSSIGNDFQTGHNVTIREKTKIGNNVSIGTLSDIQGNCTIGNYVRMHSNVHIGQLSVIDDFVWIFPYVVLTNDPTPPSENFIGVHVFSFAIITTNVVVMPGIEIGRDTLVGAGALVTKNVEPYTVVVGNPAKVVDDVRNIRNKITGEKVYPWRENFKRGMPWENTEFSIWYDSLDIYDKSKIIF